MGNLIWKISKMGFHFGRQSTKSIAFSRCFKTRTSSIYAFISTDQSHQCFWLNDEDLNDKVDDSSWKLFFNNLEFVCFIAWKLTKPTNVNDSLILVRKLNVRRNGRNFFYCNKVHTDFPLSLKFKGTLMQIWKSTHIFVFI